MVVAFADVALPEVARFARVGLEIWLLGLALIVGWRLLVEGDAFRGLLASRIGAGIEPDRLQLLVASVSGAIVYAASAVQAVQQGASRMPDVPDALITVLATSQAIYLAGKISRRHS